MSSAKTQGYQPNKFKEYSEQLSSDLMLATNVYFEMSTINKTF